MAISSTAMFVMSMAMAAASAAAQAAAQKRQAAAQKHAADARAMSLDHQAKQARAKGVQEVAVSQRAMIAKMNQGDLISSRALALAAASGADTSGSSIENTFGGIGAEGEFRALSVLFVGKNRQQDLDRMADMRIFEGVQERISGEMMKEAGDAAATATLVRAGGKMAMSSYNSGMFSTPSTSLSGQTIAPGNSGGFNSGGLY